MGCRVSSNENKTTSSSSISEQQHQTTTNDNNTTMSRNYDEIDYKSRLERKICIVSVFYYQ